MGYEEVPTASTLTFSNFSAGVFPHVDNNDIPGDVFNPTSPIGFSSASNIIWNDAALQEFPTAELRGANFPFGGASNNYSFFSTANWGTDTASFAIAGANLYAVNIEVGADSLIGATALSGDYEVDWAEWQFGADQYIIGVDGASNFTVDRATTTIGTEAGMPAGRYIAAWQSHLWLANFVGTESTIRFSNLGDITTWDADDEYIFDSEIMKLVPFGEQLVVFMGDHIGLLQGTNARDLAQTNRYIEHEGCRYPTSIVKGTYQGRAVIFFLGSDGVYAYDGTQQLIYLSFPIQRAVSAGNIYFEYSTLDGAPGNNSRITTGVFLKNRGWYIISGTYEEDKTVNATEGSQRVWFVLDLNNIQETGGKLFAPHWMIFNAPSNTMYLYTGGYVSGPNQNTNKNEQIVILSEGVSSDVTVHTLNPKDFIYDDASYTDFVGAATTKYFDFIVDALFIEAGIISESMLQSAIFYAEIGISYTFSNSAAASVRIDVAESDLLDTSFIMDTSIFTPENISLGADSINTYGRYIRFRYTHSEAANFIVSGINLLYQKIGLSTNIPEVS